ncbi:fumarylacetoacetate hydrolase family protein [Shewanella sp. D64]|uniref:fumarylacetoacetate hydrolase family protein n=1 Tax=unclassified Shewanella TaxID=196818 RepID=UPI0022BA2F10|nr:MULTISPECIES: fumarylacetoacetate hydrolase family protein [unclassified Shewanella]MEC4725419.1 fumarylacetoacetate hydrolase family protein [Shewanella sp. D64]MEC4735735.1 fumarylacetoacetate hydrolase family protein [Shewanella sp. E94]WBJ98190.1 fumarylacetoacetate hydrolase family protein [Shewanella sp. MTB7]
MNTLTVSQRTVTPFKLVCVGRNYVEHIKELGNEIPEDMLLFIKPNSAISTNLISFHHETIHYETELCFLFEQGQFVAVGIGLDLTKRTLQSELKAKSLPWERAKAFDGSAVFSDFVEIDKISDELNFELSINGVQVQVGHIGLMMNSPELILTEITTFMSLQDGDIVMTGTPKGVGVVNLDDLFEVTLFDGKTQLIKAHWKAS